MFLFPNFTKPGPGVNPDTPRKKGAARFFELLGRDLVSFYLASMLVLISALPWGLGLAVAIISQALLPMIAAGVLGGMLAAPQAVALYDTILRAMRDEPGYWWATYRRVWKRNAKASLPAGALFGLLLAAAIFEVFFIGQSGGVLPGVALVVALFFLAALIPLVIAQIALLELPLIGVLKNAILLFFGFLPRAALGALWQLVYWGAFMLLLPYSAFVLVLTSMWLPALLSLMAFYPVLDKVFHLEEKITAMRAEDLAARTGDGETEHRED